MSLECSLSMSVLYSSNGVTSTSELSCLANSPTLWYQFAHGGLFGCHSLFFPRWMLQTQKWCEWFLVLLQPIAKERRHPVSVQLFHRHSSLPHYFAHAHGQWQSIRISSETWPKRIYHFEILEQHQGVLYRDYTYLLQEQTSIESSECGLVWRTKVSAWLVCLHTNQSLLYAKKAHMPVLAVPVQRSCTSIGTEDAYPFVVYTSSKTLWVTLREAFHMHIICFPQEDMQCTSSNLIGCFFCVYHVSKRNLGSLAPT